MTGAYAGLAFSPDGEAVLYVFGPEDGLLSLFQIPVLGGPPRKLVQDINTAPAFSPDGKRMAFVRGMADGGQVIVLANADGTDERRLASRPESDVYAQTRVAWSPDGTEIAAFAGAMPKQRSRIVLVNVESGKEHALQRRQVRFGRTARCGSATAAHWLFDAIEQYGGAVGTGTASSGRSRTRLAPCAGITPDLASYANLAATAGRADAGGREG